MKMHKPFRRAAAGLAALAMVFSVSVSALAASNEFWIGDGDITITVNGDGTQNVKQTAGDGTTVREETVAEGENVVINGGSSNASNKTAAQAEGLNSADGLDDLSFGVDTEEETPPDDFLEDELFAVDEEPAEEEPAPEEEPEEEPTQPAEAENAAAAEGADEDKAQAEPLSAAAQEQEAAPQADVPAPTTDPVQYVIKVISDVLGKAAKVTLSDVNIDVQKTYKAAMTIEGQGDVELELEGNNVLKSGSSHAGIEKNDRKSGGNLTIRDDNNNGSLTATGGYYGAGIGGGDSLSSSNITITGGTVVATGGQYGSGIGGGGFGSSNGKNITISGGNVTATGGYRGAGIGGGYMGDGSDIKITGGTVNATGTWGGAGIGGSCIGDGYDITISDGNVTAVSKDSGDYSGAGIGGGGFGGEGANITISGGKVKAVGDVSAAGIGGGERGDGTNITVSGNAEVTAVAGKSGKTYGAGASIGNGGYREKLLDDSGNPVKDENGKEIYVTVDGKGGVGMADISGITTGYIHHIYADGSEYWEPEANKPKPDTPATPDVPAQEPAAVQTAAMHTVLPLHVDSLFGRDIPYTAVCEGSTLTLTVDSAFARLHGVLRVLREMQAQGVETLVFVTPFKSTSLSLAEVLSRGTEDDEFALRHDGALSALAVGGEVLALPCAKS